ncbi:MAG TPA: tetratricopeptide repeat protein [Nitrospirales bacterium]|nr:tetratricopeptide repeat protein [Nitrospirales bacterium]
MFMPMRLFVLSLCFTTFLLDARPSSAAVPSNALAPYADGLDALNEGRWPDAASAFSRALDAAGDSPEIVLARGVANTLAENFGPALKDLQRAPRLGLRGREAELWTYVAEAMSGTLVEKYHGFPGGGGQPGIVSIPGHIAQGRDDYPTEYGSFIAFQLGQEYQQQRLGARFGGKRDPQGVKSPRIRQAMLKAGQLFAERNFRRPELAALNVARAKQAGGKTPGAQWAAIERALDANPGDPDAHYQAAMAWLEAGHPATARKEFTTALTLKTDFVEAYLGRAAAAAQLGDEPRLRADLAAATKLAPAAARAATPALDAELAKTAAAGSAESLYSRLQDAAKSGASLDELIGIASQLHRLAGAHRLRYDELYQDRLRALEDAVRENPRSAERLVALATCLIKEADGRGEAVEPRRALQPYRVQLSRQQELVRAIAVADRALQLNGKHVGAMMEKATALTALKQYDLAEALADRALQLAGDNPDALRLYAKFRAMRANQLSSEASGLRQERCSSSSHDETRSDGVYRVTTTTCYAPSQADVQLAAQLEAQAADLRRRAMGALEKAAQVTRGTVDGFLIQADLSLWKGDPSAALAALQQAVKLDPKSVEAQDRLTEFYAQAGRRDEAEEQRLIAANLVQTTAAPLLRLAWNRTEKTAWQGAKGYLARAGRVDPQDARIPAYLGVVLESDDHVADAVAAYRMALALEEARLQLDERPASKPRPMGRDALDYGLAIQARFHLARLAEQAGNRADALSHYQAVLGYEQRMPRGFESREMFTAMWPDQPPDRGAVVIAPRNAATLVAEAHLRTGVLLAAMGKPDQAVEQYRIAANYGPLKMAGLPMISNGRGDSNYSGIAGAPAAEAQLYLAKALVAKGDIQEAQRVLYEAGRNLPEALQKDLGELNMAMSRLSSRQRAADDERISDDERPYVEMLRRQQQERSRIVIQRLAPNAKVVPELVGRWELTPDNQFLPKKTLTIEENASYSIVSTDGSRSQGKADVQGGRYRAQGRQPEASSGQLMLYDTAAGQIGTMWFEFTSPGVVQITDETDGTVYRAERQR